MSREQALEYAYNHQVLTLATVGPDGVWAAAVFYANENFDFYFLSAGHTRHAQHIARNPRVAATIQEDYTGWQEIKGIQLEGTVYLLAAEQQAAAVTLYREKYPFLAHADSDMQAALNQVNWYHLLPEHLYFIDNSRGLGHRERVL